MSSFRLHAIAVAVSILLVSVPSAGAEQPPVFDETRAVQAAWLNHPSIAAAKAALRRVEGAQGEAGFWFPDNPSLAVSGNTDRLGRDVGQRERVVEVSVPLWVAGQRSLRLARGESLGREAEAEVQLARWSLAGAVREAYWKTWEAGRLAAIARDRSDRSAALARLAERRWQNRDIAEIDFRQVKADAAADSMVEAERRADSSAKRAALSELTGLPVQDITTAPAPQPERFPAAPAAEEALEQRPDLRLLRARMDAARDDLAVQEREGWPNPELTLGQKQTKSDRDGPTDTAVTLGVKIPIPVVNRNQKGIAQAASDILRSEAEYRQGMLQAKREATQSAALWQGAWEQWQQAREAARLLGENLATLEKGFAIGETSALTLLQEKRRWAEVAEVEQKATAGIALARAAWQQAHGILLATPK